MYFFHPPKCGGTYVNAQFGRHRRACPMWTLPSAKGHLTYLQYRKALIEAGCEFDSAYKFAVIRNPWAWHVSWYHYLKGDPGGRKSAHVLEAALVQRLSFSDYLKWLDDPTTEKSKQGYITKQLTDFLVDEDGKLAMDRVLRQEDLENELRAMVADLNLAITVKPGRFNESEHGDYRSYYDDDAAAIVARRHKDDLRLFGYDFDGLVGASG